MDVGSWLIGDWLLLVTPVSAFKLLVGELLLAVGCQLVVGCRLSFLCPLLSCSLVGYCWLCMPFIKQILIYTYVRVA